MPVNDRIQLRRGTEAQWIAAEAADADDEPLADGEPGVVVDADGVPRYLVVGDTGTEFEDLPRFSPDSALSATFVRGHYWPRIPGSSIYLQNPDFASPVNLSLETIGRKFVDLVVVPFDAVVVAYHFSVQSAGDATATIRPALYQQVSTDATVPLELLHGGSPMAADTTGVRSVTGLSIPVTTGMVLRPAVKMETGSTAPSIHGHKTSAAAKANLITSLAYGSAGYNYKFSGDPGEWEATLVVNGSQSNGARLLVEVVPS